MLLERRKDANGQTPGTRILGGYGYPIGNDKQSTQNASSQERLSFSAELIRPTML